MTEVPANTTAENAVNNEEQTAAQTSSTVEAKPASDTEVNKSVSPEAVVRKKAPKKKRKLRKSALVILILLILGIAYGVLALITRIDVARNDILLLYGEETAEYPEASATVGTLSISDNIDYSRIGTYRITYTARLGFLPLKTKHIAVEIVDMDAPVIELEEGSVIFTKINEDYSYPSYAVTDNYNTAEEMTITIRGDVDTSTAGTYTAQLSACDVSGNCSSKSINMIVGDISNEDFEPGKFNLFDYDYSHTSLRQNETPLLSQEQFDSIYFIGDSNTLNFAAYEGLSPDHVIGRFALSPITFDLPATYNNVQTNSTITELVASIRPSHLILCMGEAEAGSQNPVKLTEAYLECIHQLKEASPETTVIVSAIFPICEGETGAASSQLDINKTNYCLLKMCEENGIPFIYGPEVLMNSDGYGYTEYYLPDGYHLAGAYYSIYFDYIKNSLSF